MTHVLKRKLLLNESYLSESVIVVSLFKFSQSYFVVFMGYYREGAALLLGDRPLQKLPPAAKRALHTLSYKLSVFYHLWVLGEIIQIKIFNFP